MKNHVIAVLIAVSALKLYAASGQRGGQAARQLASIASELEPDKNLVEIYMPPDCGGCRICKGQVADVVTAGVPHQIHVLGSPAQWQSFAEKLKAESGDAELGGAGKPIRMPMMRVNGKWLQGPRFNEIRPLLVNKSAS